MENKNQTSTPLWQNGLLEKDSVHVVWIPCQLHVFWFYSVLHPWSAPVRQLFLIPQKRHWGGPSSLLASPLSLKRFPSFLLAGVSLFCVFCRDQLNFGPKETDCDCSKAPSYLNSILSSTFLLASSMSVHEKIHDENNDATAGPSFHAAFAFDQFANGVEMMWVTGFSEGTKTELAKKAGLSGADLWIQELSWTELRSPPDEYVLP